MSTKFAIIGAARTGSTMLVKTLDGVEGICCHGELLNNQAVRGYADGFDPYAATPEEREARAEKLAHARQSDPAGFVRDALNLPGAVTGFKALYSAIFDSRWSQVANYMFSEPDMRFIHLVRHNDLRRYVSEQILMAGGTNHSAVGGRSNRSVSVDIDIEAFCANREVTQKEVERARQLLSKHEVLEVSYEEMSSRPGEVIAGVCAFLGIEVSAASVEPALKKVGASDLRDSVRNFDELLVHEATRELALSD